VSLTSFLKIAAHDPLRVGAVMPSSKSAVRSILRAAPAGAKTILEFGPGDGAVTRALLARLPADGRLLAMETNHEFVECLRLIDDPRLTVVHGDARAASAWAVANGIAGFDSAVSGIPFSLLKDATRRELVELVDRLLWPGGTFVVYQSSLLMLRYLRRSFRVKVAVALKNIPPYFIMKAVKYGSERQNK